MFLLYALSALTLGTSASGRYCCKSRKLDDTENRAKVDFWTSLPLQRSLAQLRRSVVDLDKTMWSLTSSRMKRISGPKKFRPLNRRSAPASPSARVEVTLRTAHQPDRRTPRPIEWPRPADHAGHRCTIQRSARTLANPAGNGAVATLRLP